MSPSIRESTLAALTPDSRNANRGTVRGTGFLEDSLVRFGAGRGPVCDRNGVIIAGNKTIEAAASVGMDRILIVPTDGTRLVVIQRTDLDMEGDPRARELGIVDNRAGQVNLDWDAEVLASLAADGVSLDAWFCDAEIEHLLSQIAPSAGSDPSPAESPGGETDSAPGDAGKGDANAAHGSSGPEPSPHAIGTPLLCPCCGAALRLASETPSSRQASDAVSDGSFPHDVLTIAEAADGPADQV